MVALLSTFIVANLKKKIIMSVNKSLPKGLTIDSIVGGSDAVADDDSNNRCDAGLGLKIQF